MAQDTQYRWWKGAAKRYQLHLLAGYLIGAVALLVLARARMKEIDFLSVGWIIVFVFLPLLPWLVPRLAGFLKALSPYVQTVRIGAVQLDLRVAQRTPVAIATAGMQPALPNDFASLSTSTGISSLLTALHTLRHRGGNPVAVVDLQDGHKWRLPNLYFLARLLELDPVVDEFVFTAMRGGVDGYLVGSAALEDVRHRIEQAVPEYASASANLPPRDVPTLADPHQAQPVAEDFQALLNRLGPGSGRDDDPLFGYLTPVRLRDIAGPLSADAIERLGPVLAEDQLLGIVQSHLPFVPATTGARITGLIDRDAVALTTARSALTRPQ